MTIAEKLTRIAEKIQSVFNAGVAKGTAEGIEQGRQAVYDEFWDGFQYNGKRTDYSFGFAGVGWNDSILKPKHIIKPSNANQMFYMNTAIVDLRPLNDKINWSGNYGVMAMCRSCTSLKYAGKIAMYGATSMNEIFYGCSNLVSVDELYIYSKTSGLTNAFYNCTSLTDIAFAGTIAQSLDMRYSPLNKASIESVIGHLSTTATGKTLTLKKTAKEAAFTDEEWITLIGPISNQYNGNWTISLV